jgi:hypothetical protein
MCCLLYVGTKLKIIIRFVLCNLNFRFYITFSTNPKWHCYTNLYRERNFYKNKLPSANVEAVSNFAKEVNVVYRKRQGMLQ